MVDSYSYHKGVRTHSLRKKNIYIKHVGLGRYHMAVICSFSALLLLLLASTQVFSPSTYFTSNIVLLNVSLLPVQPSVNVQVFLVYRGSQVHSTFTFKMSPLLLSFCQ